MRKLLFLLALCSFMIVIDNLSAKVASTKEIALHAKEANQPTRRSVLPIHAWQENTNVRVSFLEPPLEVTIKITNADGKVVEEMVAKLPQYIQISMYGYTGTYTIEISYGDSLFYGLFKCEE